jgi:tetratricopeptide (TPR) repeat protein
LQDSGKPIDKSTLLNMYIIRGGIFDRVFDSMDDAIIDRTISDYRKSKKIADDLKRAGKPFEDGLANINMGMGQIYDQKEEYSKANEYYSESIEIWEQMRNEGQELSDENNLAMAYMNRGANYRSLGENGKALADYNKSIDIRECLLKKGAEQDAFDVFMVYDSRSMVYKDDGNAMSAINDKITVLRVLKEVFCERPELQEIYYDTLDRTIELTAIENDKTLYNNIIQEFLYSMRLVPKTEEAETAQNNILEQLDTQW